MKTMPQAPALVKQLLDLIAQQRSAFGQERVYQRAVGLLIGELLTSGSHRITDLLRTLGLNQADWTAWYRLLQCSGRFKADLLSEQFFEQVLTHVLPEELLVVGGDVTSIPRTSKRLEGTGWGKCPRNPPFKVGIHLTQRFFNGCWLTRIENGYSRAIPLRFTPAFTEKSARQRYAVCKEQTAGVNYLHWIRTQLAQAGRSEQRVLSLFDGSYDKPDFWLNLPGQTVALVRTAKNRALKHCPPPYAGKGRRRVYGAAAPAPQAYLKHKSGWNTLHVTVRGHRRRMTYRVQGPFLRQGMAAVPLFLIVVRGQQWEKGSRHKRRLPVFYLVNAVDQDGCWQLPLPIKTLLTWAWQRWELEVVHRDLKTGLGMGDKQTFHPQSAVASVAWSAWAYANLMLVGYRTWGAANAVMRHDAWRQHHPRRYTLMSLLERCRVELTTLDPFRRLFARSTHNWLEMEQLLSHPAFTSPLTAALSP